jgi:hypothetical protein
MFVLNYNLKGKAMTSISAMIAMRPQKPDGTTLWASEKVMALLLGVDGVIDSSAQNRAIRKLQHFCDGNFRVFMPEAVKREHGKTFGVHLNQIRLVGFFDGGYVNFIAVDWFIKKTQQNDRRMNAIYEKVDKIREAGQWQKVK